MQFWLKSGAIIAVLLALIPVLMIAKMRVEKKGVPRLHPILNMDNQPRFKSQQENIIFADGRASRPNIPGTVHRGGLNNDSHMVIGKVNGEWATTFPIQINERVLQRGQEKYEIYCATCHGLAGYGGGMINERALERQEPQWIQPTDYHTDQIRERPHGHLYNTISNGIRSMPAYGDKLPPKDRWAIVAYMRALQESQNAELTDIPPEILMQRLGTSDPQEIRELFESRANQAETGTATAPVDAATGAGQTE